MKDEMKSAGRGRSARRLDRAVLVRRRVRQRPVALQAQTLGAHLGPRRRGQLELYRSGEFSELEAYEGRLASLGVPFLALWGEDDPFAPVAGAQRFAREIAGARVQVIPGTGHFVYEDAPETAAAALAAFLAEAAPR